MKENFKTFLFFLVIAALCYIPFLNEKIKEGKEEILKESENARALYTGKTRAVYDPLDEAYVVTSKLKELINKESTLDFKKFKNLPVVSLWIDPNDLYSDERGIFKNYEKRGRLWERPIFISYYEKGEKKFSSFAGARLHGDASRKAPNKSLRLHFRENYGEDSFYKEANIGFKEGSPIKRLLLRRDANLHFSNDLNFEIVKKLGGIAPKLMYVAVYLNGEFYQFMQMMEQLHEDQLKYFYGHERFLFYKLKGGDNPTRDRLLYEDAITRIRKTPPERVYKDFQKMFDIDNITANLLTLMYSGTFDWAQGIWIKNQKEKDPKWKLISWDFDLSFLVAQKSTDNLNIKPWQIESFRIIMEQHDASLRHLFFKRLIHDAPEYKEYFVQKVDKMFREDLTEEFFAKLFKKYRKLALEVPENEKLLKDISYLEEFVKRRKEVFCTQMERAIQVIPEVCR